MKRNFLHLMSHLMRVEKESEKAGLKEIKRRLVLGRKAMTNINSILEGRDITLLTKVHIVKAMVFPVVMYKCELNHKTG